MEDGETRLKERAALARPPAGPRATCALLLFTALPCFAADLSPEAQIALTSLRDGERARVEAVLGDATRLPLYRGDFTVDPAARTAGGKVALTLFTLPPRREVLLRVTPNAAHPRAVSLREAKVNGAPATIEAREPTLYRVAMPPDATAPLTLELSVHAKVPQLPNAAPGLDETQGDYGAFSATEDSVSLVGLMPMLVPEVNGRRFDPPAGLGDLGSFAPSNFLVSVTAPTPWRAVANGQAVGEVPTGKGATRFAYAVGAARDFPLVVVKQPLVVTKRSGDVELEAVLLTSDKAQAARVLRLTGDFLRALEKHLGPYPYKTLRVVEQRLSSAAGGMEFPGLVTISALLLSGEVDPLAQLGLGGPQDAMLKGLVAPMLSQLMAQTLEFALAHELAHQYTAMLVGNDPVGDPAADEPLTQHLALLAMEWVGSGDANAMREGQLKMAYQLHRMLGGADGRVDRPASRFRSNREYGAIIYGKAPLLFDALRKKLGDETWERVLKRYVEQNRYQWVTSRTLTDLAGAESNQRREVEALRRHWWEELHGDEDLVPRGQSTGLENLDPATMKQLQDVMKALSGE